MSSDESDDKPLASLATAKKEEEDDSEGSIDRESDDDYVPNEPAPKKRKPARRKRHKTVVTNNSLTISLVTTPKRPGRPLFIEKPVVQLPQDVWLYLKDLNRSGPYSCLVCTEIFVSRLKMIGHYILNHGKAYCGICRYIVADKEAWEAHLEYHAPWTCSQCGGSFPIEAELSQHLREVHSEVHCRICYIRMPMGETYHNHLRQKHNVKHVDAIDEEFLWKLTVPSGAKFDCILCSKANLSPNFLNHFVGFHHFTLRCFGSIVSAKYIPFRVSGANITENFKKNLIIEGKCGYVGLLNSISSESKPVEDSVTVKVEQVGHSDSEDSRDCKQDINVEQILGDVKSYNGSEDVDLTLTEVLLLQKSSYEYLELCFTNIEARKVPELSNIGYESVKSVLTQPIGCPLCHKTFDTYREFNYHMGKLHWIKVIKTHVCRICLTPFDSQIELDSHIAEKLADFKDLWICQFCDKEFEDRITTRNHLSEHWDELEPDNCFSPHLGFKCRNCPCLFWNEPEREEHQIKAHMSKTKEQHYTCTCGETFSDKAWFIHHYYGRHQPNELFLLKCCLCTKVLPTVDDMRGHFISEHPEAKKVFCCLGNCRYLPLGKGESFESHLKIHLPADPAGKVKKTYACLMCHEEFPTRRQRMKHSTQMHGSGRFRCKICDELLWSIDERKLHYLIRHQGQQPYKCSDCGKAFQYKSSLCIHKRNHLPDQKNYICHFCQKSFAKKDSYREHLQIHEGPQYTCSYCPQQFVQRSNMIRHERRHTGERPFSCDQCGRTFADKGACTAHIRTHSKDSQFECGYCHTTFVQKQKLTYHLRRHTGENLETCSVCSKIFTSTYALRVHMKTHERKDEECAICPICKRSYADKRSMMRHLRSSHTNARYYVCPICSKRVTNAQGLRSHVLTHATKNMFWCKFCPKSYVVKRTMLKHLSRRHRVRGKEENLKQHYTQLDPRHIGLELDEEGIVSVFGAQRKVTEVEIPIENAHLLAYAKWNTPKKSKKPVENTRESTSSEDSDKEDENEKEDEKKCEEEREGPKIKTEPGLNSDEERPLEPTDFVTVKIEPMYSDGTEDD